MPVKFSKFILLSATFISLVGLASGVAAVPPDHIAAYLAARDRYVSLPEDSPMAKPVLADLEQRLKTIVPPWKSPGFSIQGMNFGTLPQPLGRGALDGLVYSAKGTKVIVTTTALFQNWIEYQSNNTGSPSTDIDTAIRTSDVWASAVEDMEAGWFFFGRVPVKVPGGTETALLVAATDSGFVDSGPTDLLVAVLRDDRIFVARQSLTTNVPYQPICGSQYRKENTAPAPPLIQVPTEQAVSDFQACFAPHLHQQPQYHAIEKQAQTLVDLLH